MAEPTRRAVLGGAALSALGSAGPAPSQGPDLATLLRRFDGTLPPGLLTIPDRDLLRAQIAPAPGTLLFLSEAGREGVFVCRDGAPPADPLEGLAIVSMQAPGRHYARIWDGIHGRPEWFGAEADNWRADCADAIEACYALCPVTQLAQADYFVRRTVRFGRSWRTVRGVGNHAPDQGRGTRIILQGQSPGIHQDDIVQIGSVEQPSGSSDDYPTEIHLAHVTLIRDGASASHASGDLRRFPAGLRVAFVVRSTVREVTSLESSVGFYIGGTVYTKFDDCLAMRARAGVRAANDRWIGYLLDGRPRFGFAGGNASIYINRCIAVGQHPRHVAATGLLGIGAFVDTFLDNFESARIATGIAFDVAGARDVGQTIDVHVRGAVLDACSDDGIRIDLDATSSASIEIIDPYIYAAGGGGERGIAIHDGAGLATVTGGQVHGDFRGGSLWFSRTRGVRVQGTKIQQSLRPVVVDEASGLVLEPQINNAGKASDAFALTLNALSRSSVRPVVIGAAGPSFRGGIAMDARCAFSQVDPTGIDPGCFAQAGNAAMKVTFAGQDARAGAGRAGFERARNVIGGVLD